MPKLPSKAQKEIENTEEGTDSYLLPDGRYAARLIKVEERTSNSSGSAYWVWEFDALHDEDGKRKAGRQWYNTFPHSTKDYPKQQFKALYAALGYSLDSDTDEMIGEWVVLRLGTEVQTAGARAGQKVNRVLGVAEFESDEWDFDPDEVPAAAAAAATSSASGSDDSF